MRKMVVVLMLVFAACAICASVSFAQGASCKDAPVAVINLKVENIQGVSALGAINLIEEHLSKDAGYNIVDLRQVYEIFNKAKFKQTVSTQDDYLLKAGKVLGVKKVISGVLSKTPEGIKINLKVVDLDLGRKTFEVEKNISSEKHLNDALLVLSRQLLGEAVAGPVIFNSNYSGTEIFIDDKFIGKTPHTVQFITTGKHKIKAVKKGYKGKEFEEEINNTDFYREIKVSVAREDISAKTFKLLAENITWEKIKPATNSKLRSIAKKDREIFIVGDKGTVLSSKDNGKTWEETNAGTQFVLYDIAFAPNGDCYIPGGSDFNYSIYYSKQQTTGVMFGLIGNAIQEMNLEIDGILLRSKDEKTFSVLDEGKKKIFYEVCFTDDKNGYIAGTYDAGKMSTGRFKAFILKTEDGGNTWSRTEFKNRYPMLSVYAKGNCIWGLSETGGVFRSTDAGKNYEEVSSKIKGYSSCIFFTDENTGFIVGEGGSISKSVDGGKTWKTLDRATQNNLERVYFVTPQLGFASGKSVILFTADGGETWTKMQGDFGSSCINDIYFDEDTGALAAADMGTIFKLDTDFEKISKELYHKAVQLIKEDKTKEAKDILESIIEINQDYAQAYAKLIEVCEKMNLPEEAKLYKEELQKLNQLL